MWKNYIKTAWRSLWKNKLTSAINVLGLSIGIACASLAYLFIQHEISFDKFHDRAENIYWFRTVVNDMFFLSGTPPALSLTLAKEFPEITESFRLETGKLIVESGQELQKEEPLFVDANFFEFFDFKLLEGNPTQVLTQPNSIVLNEEMAQKYFGRRSPLGKPMIVYYQGRKEIVTVTGVAQMSPSNSSVQYSMLLPLAFAHQQDEVPMNANWNDFSSTNFVRFRSQEDIVDFEEKLQAFVAKKYPKKDADGKSPYNFYLESFAEYHFNAARHANGLVLKANNSYVRILMLIAILMLLVACLNFTNLSNARGSRRLTEVGVRQVLGAEKQQLRVQFLSESLLLSSISVVLAVGIIQLLLRFATQIFDYQLQIDWLSLSTLFPLAAIALITGLLAGIYPAFLLSSLSTVNTFKSNFKIGGNNIVTKASLVFQFALSIGLVACTLIMFQQQQYISQKNLGFKGDAIVVVETQIQSKDETDTEQLLNQYKAEIFKHPAILEASGVSYSFTRGNSGRMIEDGEKFSDFVFDYKIDPDYIDLLELELLEGRNFSSDRQEDFGKTVIVNETFKERLVEGGILDTRLSEEYSDLAGATIIGLIKDYNFLDLKQSINPLILHMQPDKRFHHFLIKVDATNMQKAIAHLKSSWQKISPTKPFAYSFLDEDLQRQYRVETRWVKVTTGATILAILIAFMGLFGLVALSLAERTKEIGIRQILGASLANIVALFSKDFMLLIGIALLLAAPIAWYFMQQWLADFHYRVNIQWWVFPLAALVAVLISLCTVGFQSIKALVKNPIRSLRDE